MARHSFHTVTTFHRSKYCCGRISNISRGQNIHFAFWSFYCVGMIPFARPILYLMHGGVGIGAFPGPLVSFPLHRKATKKQKNSSPRRWTMHCTLLKKWMLGSVEVLPHPPKVRVMISFGPNVGMGSVFHFPHF